MSQTITPAPIRCSVEVKVPPARAFEIFTGGASRWWLKTHTINATKSPIKDVIIEPRAGGRWFERGEDGSECEWGRVLAWEPPHHQGPGRLLLAWQINAEFKYDASLLTEVEIRFTPAGSGTLVELEHRLIERMGERGVGMRDAFTRGWGLLLETFAKQVI
jgi:uncharacterized protein YndB with AHSA1/START domain